MAAKRKMYLIVQHVVANDLGLYAGTEATHTGTPVMLLDNEEKAIGQAGKLEREARKVPKNEPPLWRQSGNRRRA